MRTTPLEGRAHDAGPRVVIGNDGLARPAWAARDPLLRDDYDTEWGMPVTDERGVYQRISLEGFQSGLSWATILRKRPAFRAAFDGFIPDTIARSFGWKIRPARYGSTKSPRSPLNPLLMEAIGIVDTHLLDSHRRGSSGVWPHDGAPRMNFRR